MTDWTSDQEDIVRALWADGLSAAQIANELGSFSRNAVLGKVHRLGLSSRQEHKNIVRHINPRKEKRGRDKSNFWGKNGRERAPRFSDEPLPITAADDLAIPEEQRRSILELNANTCRWPVGDPDKPNFYFCGALPEAGRPYCAGHARVAYRIYLAAKNDAPTERPWMLQRQQAAE